MQLASRLRTCSAAILFLAAAAAASAQPPAYRVRDLGVLPFGTDSELCVLGKFLNESGQAIIQGGSGFPQAFLIDTDGTRTFLGSLFGLGDQPLAINEAAQIVGTSGATSVESPRHLFFWSRTTGMIDITPDLTAESASLCGLNDHGDVVGLILSQGATFHPFIYIGGRRFDLNTEVSLVGLPSGIVLQMASATNNARQVRVEGVTPAFESHLFLLTPISGNLLVQGDFEDYAPPDLGPPGWIADPIRQIAAKSETNQPHSGTKNGACWATVAQDCGMFQEVIAPGTGAYTLTFFANADRDGGLVGANVNGNLAASSSVAVRGFGNYGTIYSVSFNAVAGDTIRVWMYSPASPGYVVIDDASLAFEGLAP